MRPVAQRHERAFEGMTIDFAPDLDQATGSKKLNRFWPDDKCPSALGRAFLQSGGKESGQRAVIFFSRGHGVLGSFGLHLFVEQPGSESTSGRKTFLLVPMGELRGWQRPLDSRLCSVRNLEKDCEPHGTIDGWPTIQEQLGS